MYRVQSYKTLFSPFSRRRRREIRKTTNTVDARSRAHGRQRTLLENAGGADSLHTAHGAQAGGYGGRGGRLMCRNLRHCNNNNNNGIIL